MLFLHDFIGKLRGEPSEAAEQQSFSWLKLTARVANHPLKSDGGLTCISAISSVYINTRMSFLLFTFKPRVPSQQLRTAGVAEHSRL